MIIPDAVSYQTRKKCLARSGSETPKPAYDSSGYRELNVHGFVHRNNILIHIQQNATLHSLFYLETALHVSGGTITHRQERKQLYLQHLVFVTPLLLYAAIVEELEPVWVCCGWRTPPTAHSNRHNQSNKLPLWAVRPVHSLSAYTRVHFTFTF
jgi:hypothetical protein